MEILSLVTATTSPSSGRSTAKTSAPSATTTTGARTTFLFFRNGFIFGCMVFAMGTVPSYFYFPRTAVSCRRENTTGFAYEGFKFALGTNFDFRKGRSFIDVFWADITKFKDRMVFTTLAYPYIIID